MTFGTVFSDRMATARFRDGEWSDFKLEEVRPLPLHPAAHVLHYGSNCFEGLKAYRWPDGSIRVFRLNDHIDRMRSSAELLCLSFPGERQVIEMVRATVDAAREDVPEPPAALYIRPTLIGTQPSIGAATKPSDELLLFVLVGPVGDYFAGGLRPLKIVVDDQAMRSTPGFGAAKTGANYAAALRHLEAARLSHQADQVLFAPGGLIEETGAANLLLIDDGEIVTSPADGSILPGMTRRSILELAPLLGWRVEERRLGIDELISRAATGEVILAGTAAVIAGVGTMIYGGEEIVVGDGGTGPHTESLRRALTDIQFGRAEDPFGWLQAV